MILAVPAQAETFNGPYGGVAAGWERSEAARRIDGLAIDAEVSRDAPTFGGFAGYNHKIGESVVIGAEAGIAVSTDDRIRAAAGGRELLVDPRYSFDLGARAGYLVTDKALLYVRGGYANTRVRTSLETLAGIVRSHENLDGWQIGGGVEYALSQKISARAEYRYSDLGQQGARYQRHQTLIGVSYNF